MEYAVTLGQIRSLAAVDIKPKPCESCARLEALVHSERNRANEYLRLLNEAQLAHQTLIDNVMIKFGVINPLSSNAVEKDYNPFGGRETLRQKQDRLSAESKKRAEDNKKSVESN
jgi:hypothetical protein